jgi:GNAT superfamily N-acetyltransferase
MAGAASDLVLSLEEEPAEPARAAVLQGLRAYNRQHVEAPDFRTLVLAARHGNVVIGGLVGETGWQWLHIELLWVADGYRRRGLGRWLLRAAEQEARLRGASHAYLDTFDFQARSFYEREGYVVFGVQDGYPPGHSRFYLRKKLFDDESGSVV